MSGHLVVRSVSVQRFDATLAFVDASPADAMTRELRSFLAGSIELARKVTDADPWTAPWAHSQAGQELGEEERRRPPPQAGSWPWLLAPVIARLALQVAIEEAEGFHAVIGPAATSYAADAVCRAVLESCSLAWWLLDPGLGPRARLARALAYRLHTAKETERAIGHLGLGPGGDPAEYGELPDAVRQEIRELGPDWACHPSGAWVSWGDREEQKESWPSYSDRAADLVRRIWPQQEKMPYAVLSAVAHAELLGLARGIPGPGPARPSATTAPDAVRSLAVPTGFWLWHDAYLVIGALVFTSDRAASFLTLDDQLAALRSWTGELDRALPRLQPHTP